MDLETPTTMIEACRLLAEAAGRGLVLAGGTDLLPRMRRGQLRPGLLVSLRRVEGLRAVEPHAGGLRVGALATMADLEAHPHLAGPFAGLAEGAASVGGPLVRNRATVGGNVVSARPCADTAAPLAALGARLHLTGAGGERVADMEGFITGPGETLRRPDEVLTWIELPAPGGRAGSAYLKVARRHAMEITVAGCAASVTLDGDRVTRARLYLTSVGPVPIRVRGAERALEGEHPRGAAVAAAAAAAREECRPIDDLRAPAAYRREVVEVLARRALAAALARAEGDA